MPPVVSVVVTCHNFRPYIAETLRSLADQTHDDFEVIVVDNNSTDGSPEIIERFAATDRRFALVREAQQGVHHALNAGIACARGDIVCLLDGDDTYRPERLEKTVRHFEETGADFVACNGQRMDNLGRLEEMFEAYFHSPESMPAVLCQYNPIWTVSFLAVKRSALRALGELPEEFSRILDWHLLMSAYEHGLRVSYLDEPLVLKRYHGKNLAFDLEVTEQQAIPRIDRFMRASSSVRDLYGPFDRGRLLTVRYVRAVHQMRRADRWAALTDYLADYVGPDRIREEVHRFVTAIAWYHLDRTTFLHAMEAYSSDHPLWMFLEALNSWAVAMAQFDPPRAMTLLEQLVEWSPDYRDARLNLLYLKRGQQEHCRHTICLRPYTLHWLAEWP
jgi:glycosyltransferase involved in cell wall biosynthesis